MMPSQSLERASETTKIPTIRYGQLTQRESSSKIYKSSVQQERAAAAAPLLLCGHFPAESAAGKQQAVKVCCSFLLFAGAAFFRLLPNGYLISHPGKPPEKIRYSSCRRKHGSKFIFFHFSVIFRLFLSFF